MTEFYREGRRAFWTLIGMGVAVCLIMAGLGWALYGLGQWAGAW